MRAAEKMGGSPPTDPLAFTFPGPADTVAEIDLLKPEARVTFAGQAFNDVKAAHKDTIRDAIAHITPPGRGESTVNVADRFVDLQKCRDAIPVLRYIARKALEVEIARVDGQA